MSVQGNVYAAAQTNLGTASVNFGTVRRGTALGAQNVAVSNTAAVASSKATGAGALIGDSLSYSFDLGTIVQGADFAAATLRLTNVILASLPGDSLVGTLSASAAAQYQLGGLGSIGELAPEGFYDMLVDIDTSTLGSFLGTSLFNGASHNNFQTDLSLAQVSITLRAQIVSGVPPGAVPEPASGALMGLGAGALWWLRRRRVAAPDG